MESWADIRALTLVLVGAFGLVQVLRALAMRVRNEVVMHDLRVNVSRLQAQNYRATMLRHGIAPIARADEAVAGTLDAGETLEEARPVEPARADTGEQRQAA